LGANPWQAGKKEGGSRGRPRRKAFGFRRGKNFYPLVLAIPVPFGQRESGRRAVAGGACPPRRKRTLNNQRQQAID